MRGLPYKKHGAARRGFSVGAFAITPRPFRSPLYPFENDNIAKVLHIVVRLDDSHWVARCAFWYLLGRGLHIIVVSSYHNTIYVLFRSVSIKIRINKM